jgi:hypothetical protein
MVRGWAYFADSMENDAWLRFCGVNRSAAGYVKQQKDWLIKNARINKD